MLYSLVVVFAGIGIASKTQPAERVARLKLRYLFCVSVSEFVLKLFKIDLRTRVQLVHVLRVEIYGFGDVGESQVLLPKT